MAKKAKTNVSFKAWATTIARARGKAATEVATLKGSFPVYKNEKLYATKYPAAWMNFQNYQARGSQAA